MLVMMGAALTLHSGTDSDSGTAYPTSAAAHVLAHDLPLMVKSHVNQKCILVEIGMGRVGFQKC